jgi:hypothetical protein
MATTKFVEMGINTDDLDEEELRKLVENNRELHSVEISNIEHEVRDISFIKDKSLIAEDNEKNKEEKSKMINELYEKE